MIPSQEYDQTRVEFAEKWSRSNIEDLLQTNHYKRAREERRLYKHYLPRDQLILEAGCGLGPKVLYFREQGFNVIGADFVYSALERLKAFSSSTPVTCCDVHHCPFPDNTFGAYLSYGVVDFPHGPEEAIKEAYRILKSDGVILMMVPAENFLSRFIHDPDNFLQRLRRNPMVRKILGKPPCGSSQEHDLFMKFHTRREMCGILEGSGFQVLVQEPVSHSFSLFMLCERFQKDHLEQTNLPAEVVGGWLKKIAPWGTANHLLFVGRK